MTARSIRLAGAALASTAAARLSVAPERAGSSSARYPMMDTSEVRK